MAPRIARRLAGHRVALVKAPAEYEPVAVVLAALRELSPEVWHVHLPDDEPNLVAALRSSHAVAVSFPADDPPSALESLPEMVGRERGIIVGQPPANGQQPVVYVAVGDYPAEAALTLPRDATLDHTALVATEAEIRAVYPELTDDDALHSVAHATGGVPGLLAFPVDPEGDEMTYLLGLRDHCQPWADRIYPQVVADPITMLYTWAGRQGLDAMAAWATMLAGSPVTEDDVSRAHKNTFFSATCHHPPCIPDALSIALRNTMSARDRAFHDELRQKLVDAAANGRSVRSLERIKLLTILLDWPGVDRLLSRHMGVLSLLSPVDRTRMAASWPEEVSRSWPHMAHARRFFDGTWKLDSVSAGLPVLWQELTYLLEAVTPAPGSFAELVRDYCGKLVRARAIDLRASREHALGLVEWLAQRTHELEAMDRASRHDDDVALLIKLQLGAADAMIVLGEVTQAQACVRRATRMARVLVPGCECHRGLRASALARGAYLAASGGLERATRSRLAEFEAMAAQGAVPDPLAERLITITRTFLTLSVEGLDADREPQLIDPDLPFAPQEAEAEALQVLLRHGVVASMGRLTALANRAGWSNRPAWEWWPLFSILALVEARCEHPRLASTWLDRADLPPALDLTVRAALELAAKRPASARKIAEHVLRMHDVPNRWRLIAAGVKLACIEGSSTEARRERELLLNMEDWSSVLGVVVLFPDNARRLVVTHIGGGAGGVRGLGAEDGVSTGRRDVKLTPRQIDVLKALSTGQTMGEIAKSMYLGQETIRSTAKELYRRLGVHDRDSAVQMGRALGVF